MLMTAERDNRVINHMDPDTKWVHIRLEAWVPWAKGRGIAGYPRQSLTEKAALYGKLGIPQESVHRPEPQIPDREARTDAAICRLGDIDRKVIRTYYLDWAPVEVMARKCGMRVPQFRNVLKRARWRLWGFLQAAEERV